MTTIINVFIFLTIVLTGTFRSPAQLGGSRSIPPTTAERVELNKYAGKWYEIARYPNRFQKQCIGNTSATYVLKGDGRLEIKNECLKNDGKMDRTTGVAKVVDKTSNAKLKVRFAPKALSFLTFVWGDYWILDLDPDYRHVMVGDPGRDYFWILSREPAMEDALYLRLLRKAESLGFDPVKVQKTPQKAVTS
jgi:apolipoprotein D and lipocalin family protein